eukprot:GFYU01047970.1.p1 GENE.GFYU01047970.1~~GFYU01047970.1.p1  ORF type:complete len:316 (+),score=74.18 GFYU01047970.1:226-1173(+)
MAPGASGDYDTHSESSQPFNYMTAGTPEMNGSHENGFPSPGSVDNGYQHQVDGDNDTTENTDASVNSEEKRTLKRTDSTGKMKETFQRLIRWRSSSGDIEQLQDSNEANAKDEKIVHLSGELQRRESEAQELTKALHGLILENKELAQGKLEHEKEKAELLARDRSRSGSGFFGRLRGRSFGSGDEDGKEGDVNGVGGSPLRIGAYDASKDRMVYNEAPVDILQQEYKEKIENYKSKINHLNEHLGRTELERTEVVLAWKSSLMAVEELEKEKNQLQLSFNELMDKYIDLKTVISNSPAEESHSDIITQARNVLR